MFGWRRRNDGFEWHKYVRTTIKLRREDRKKRIEDIKEAAAAGVVDAGKASANAGRSMLQILWSWLVSGVRVAGVGIAKTPAAIGRLLIGTGRVLRPVGSGIASITPNIEPLVNRPGIPALLLLFAVASAASGVSRLVTTGFDVGTGLLLLVGTLLAISAAIPFVKRISQSQSRLPKVPLPSMPGLHNRALQTGAASALAIVLVGGAGWFLWPYMTNLAGQISSATLPSISQPPLEGRARAVTGDTIVVAGQVVRLSGIEAPELTQVCRNSRRRRWRCGRASRQALSKIIGSRKVVCNRLSTDSSGFKVGTCQIGEDDIAMRLLRRGHVFSTASSYGSYATEETAARTAKLGIWSGPAQSPKEYRTAAWNSAKGKAPEGCPIKGRVTRGGKIYLLPWSPSYRSRKVRKSRGERWFCSESDALAAGWKPDPAS